MYIYVSLLCVYVRMELKYMGLDVEAGYPVDDSPVRSTSRKRFANTINGYLQITSAVYQHGVPERKLSFLIFLIFFVCFISSAFSLFTVRDVCFSHKEGLERLIAERDLLREQLAKFGAKATNTTNPL